MTTVFEVTLCQVAEMMAKHYRINPMNGDGSNHMVDNIVVSLNAMAGSDAPQRAFEDAWDKRMDEHEAQNYGGNGMQRRERRAKQRKQVELDEGTVSDVHDMA